MQTAVNQKLV